jgi:hypothetical protein
MAQKFKTAILGGDITRRVAIKEPCIGNGLVIAQIYQVCREEIIMTHCGSCFCGAIELEVKGCPAGMGYCHCQSCRTWSGSPLNAFTLWKPEAVKVTKGADLINAFQKSSISQRRYCSKCGGHLMTNHPTFGLVDIFAATIPTLNFIASLHVNYSETVLPMRDGLPKLKDFPVELGGSGETVAE